jgi:hypothetical protein
MRWFVARASRPCSSQGQAMDRLHLTTFFVYPLIFRDVILVRLP